MYRPTPLSERRGGAGGMNVTESALWFTVEDLAASVRFFTSHLRFREAVVGDGFTCLTRDDAAVDIVLQQRDAGRPPRPSAGRPGVIVSFTVTGIVAEHERLRREDAPITTPLREAPWGEWQLRLTDPNGIVVQLVEWVPPAGF
ncbi:VOC family protein [Nonomuraea sp. SYSU D8015]|uniref:VOC family protein n=1 Tax=Nonomuraea sp. SYSU D8015 TaxID=2593644 RepID=UPI001CB6CCEC|nr:VOC family protein [Nonomuraea sp. SYSU D8015]